MIGLGINNRSFRRRPLRTCLERVTVALAIAILLAAGAFARSFEPLSQEQGEKAAQPAMENGKIDSDSDKSKPSKADDLTKTKNVKQDWARTNQATSSRSKDERAKTALPKRPSRSVSPPTLTSAELDRL